MQRALQLTIQFLSIPTLDHSIPVRYNYLCFIDLKKKISDFYELLNETAYFKIFPIYIF